MSTETTQLEQTDNEAVQQLQHLDQRSQGDWITVTCTSVESKNREYADREIRFVFEYHHKEKETTRQYEVPDSLPDSNVKNFLDSVGYSVQNVSLLEGDELWYNPVQDMFANEPPSTTTKLYENIVTSLRETIQSRKVKQTRLLFEIIGGIFLLPLGCIVVTYFSYLDQKQKRLGDYFPTISMIFITILLSVIYFNFIYNAVFPLF